MLKLSARPTGVLGVPNVKFVGNIHGNEPVGRELILHLIEVIFSVIFWSLLTIPAIINLMTINIY